MEKITGKFNKQFENSYIIYGNEIEGMSHKDYQKLKSFISEDFAEIEGKGKQAYQLINRWRFILDGNDIDKFTSSDNERRIYYLKISDSKKGDFDYWKEFNSLLKDEKFINSIFNYLNQYDYNKDYLYDVPQSQTQKSVVKLSRSVFYQEIVDLIGEEENVSMEIKNGKAIKFIASQTIVEATGITPQALHKVMIEINPSFDKERIKIKGRTVRGYHISK